MRFAPAPLPGAWILESEPAVDGRGYFVRTFDRAAFAERGLAVDFAQCSVSHNARQGTLRGMHWQAEPHGESKFILCVRGAVFDVLLDLRPDSPSYLRWFGRELRPGGTMLYAPPGVAHGFLTLEDASAVYYHITPEYHPESARGVRWNDPAFAIAWPAEARVVSERDAVFPDWRS